jgi:hypothetical protein
MTKWLVARTCYQHYSSPCFATIIRTRHSFPSVCLMTTEQANAIEEKAIDAQLRGFGAVNGCILEQGLVGMVLLRMRVGREKQDCSHGAETSNSPKLTIANGGIGSVHCKRGCIRPKPFTSLLQCNHVPDDRALKFRGTNMKPKTHSSISPGL